MGKVRHRFRAVIRGNPAARPALLRRVMRVFKIRGSEVSVGRRGIGLTALRASTLWGVAGKCFRHT